MAFCGFQFTSEPVVTVGSARSISLPPLTIFSEPGPHQHQVKLQRLPRLASPGSGDQVRSPAPGLFVVAVPFG